MAIWNLYSKRQKRRRGEMPDVYQYDVLPDILRGQIVHIAQDAVGRWHQPKEYTYNPPHIPNVLWLEIYRLMIRELGQFALSDRYASSPPNTQCVDYLMTAPTEQALDLIEVIFRTVDGPIRNMHPEERRHYGIGDPDAAIAELNGRFREHGVGFEFAGGYIVRIDSQYVHAEAVRPALALLHGSGKGFSGPLDEFTDAHQKYRRGEYKDAIISASKSFESTMKAICKARRWSFDPHKDTAATLIKIVFDNGLIPDWLQSQFGALRSVLEAGLPTTRNKTAGHGQGATPVNVPPHLARYALNLAATNIVLLIESHQAL